MIQIERLTETATRLLSEATADFGVSPTNDGYKERLFDAQTRLAQVQMAVALHELAKDLAKK